QAIDIDPRAGPEYDAVRIDEENTAVRLQRAQDLRRILSRDAIQHTARGALLNEARELARHDRELLPVENRPRRVGDEKLVARGYAGGLTSDHLHAGRIRNRTGSQATPQRRCEGFASQRTQVGVPAVAHETGIPQ